MMKKSNLLFLRLLCYVQLVNILLIPIMADNGIVTNYKQKVKRNLMKRAISSNNVEEGKNYIDDETPLQLTSKERRQLEKVYGSKMVSEHLDDIRVARDIGQSGVEIEHKIPWKGETDTVTGIDMQIIDDARLNAVNPQGSSEREAHLQSANTGKSLDPAVVKHLLQDLLQRIDGLEENSIISEDSQQAVVAIKNGHCNIHGLWLSSVAGSAIELIPVERDGHIEIGTNIFDLPDNPQQGMITSKWSGKGMISSESPTTITIVFQEHIEESENKKDDDLENENSEAENSLNLPKTAVFVGQCLVCENSPVLQGTWVVFPNTQSCLVDATDLKETTLESEKRTPDTMYLLKR